MKPSNYKLNQLAPEHQHMKNLSPLSTIYGWKELPRFFYECVCVCSGIC